MITLPIPTISFGYLLNKEEILRSVGEEMVVFDESILDDVHISEEHCPPFSQINCEDVAIFSLHAMYNLIKDLVYE